MKTEPSGRWLSSPLTTGSAERQQKYIQTIQYENKHSLIRITEWDAHVHNCNDHGFDTQYFDKVQQEDISTVPIQGIRWSYLSRSLDTSSSPDCLYRQRNMQIQPFLVFLTQLCRILHSHERWLLRNGTFFLCWLNKRMQERIKFQVCRTDSISKLLSTG